MDNTFTYKPIERNGQTFHIATANEYPWINVQIIPFPKEQHDETIAKIKAQPTIGWVIEHPTRRDFAVIHAGGNEVPLHFTQENHERIAADMQECMRNAAKWWAESKIIKTQSFIIYLPYGNKHYSRNGKTYQHDY